MSGFNFFVFFVNWAVHNSSDRGEDQQHLPKIKWLTIRKSFLKDNRRLNLFGFVPKSFKPAV